MDEFRRFVAPDGVSLAYRLWFPARPAHGAHPLVLLHGAASNSTRWWHFVDHSRLAPERVLLRPDLRGHGESVWRGPARVTHWADDLEALVRHERLSRAIVAGHCLGANLALHFAARYPDSTAGLVLIEPMDRRALTGRLAWLRRFAPVLNVAAVLIGLLNRLGLYRRQLAAVDLRELDRPVHEVSEEDVEQALSAHGAFWHDVKVLPLAQLLVNFVELSRPLPIGQVRCPVLVIQASGRRMTDAALTRKLLADLPAAEFVELPSEHWIPTTHPDRLCALIDDWVQRIDPS